MILKFDIERIASDPMLNMLTWEVIEARGIATGDLMSLWMIALDMAAGAAREVMRAAVIEEDLESLGISASLSRIYETHILLAKYFVRDAQEVVKFLHSRGFSFPSEYVGKRGDTDDGVDLWKI